MNIIINHTLMVPIYEQIVDQVKKMIRDGELVENDALPSVRSLSKDLKISALTVKKAYDTLESEGFTTTIHGKGTYSFWRNKKKKWKPNSKKPFKRADAVASATKICAHCLNSYWRVYNDYRKPPAKILQWF